MIELLLLGPVELRVDGEPVALPAKPRALLALLALHANRPVSRDTLVDELWEDRPPERAVKTVQVYVSQLRKALGRDRVKTTGGGYMLVLDEDELDRPRAQLMLALYRSGRQEEALALFRSTREDLVERLGIEPGPELRDLHARILQQDRELAAPSPVASPAPVPARTRKRTGVLAGV